MVAGEFRTFVSGFPEKCCYSITKKSWTMVQDPKMQCITICLRIPEHMFKGLFLNSPATISQQNQFS